MPAPQLPTVTVTRNGPYIVQGPVPLADLHMVVDAQGDSVEWREGKAIPHGERFKLCRCGQSLFKPFCDNTHNAADFEGAESASHGSFHEQTTYLRGPELSLQDAVSFCAAARFCNPAGGIRKLVEQTDEPLARAEFLHQAEHCPAGRLVAVDNFAAAELEPELDPLIGLVVDTREHQDGPLALRGGIRVIAEDGFEYAVRNRVTLCRCGASKNKPFCDGSHAPKVMKA